MAEHQWSDNGQCLNAGCPIVRNAARSQWRRHGCGHSKWRRTPIPPCSGQPPAERCSYVEHVPVELNRGHSVVGGVSVGQCERDALPRMVVCAYHAPPDAVRLLVLSMAKEIERLKQLPPAPRDNHSEH